MYRYLKILLVLAVAAWGLVGALFNTLDWSGTTGAVGATTAMSGMADGGDRWQATDNAFVIIIGAAIIPSLKIISALLCLIGAWAMWRARAAEALHFQRAKQAALAGCAVAVLLLFAGWIVIAESWFEMWRSEVWRSAALETAFRYAGFIALIALMVGQRDD